MQSEFQNKSIHSGMINGHTLTSEFFINQRQLAIMCVQLMQNEEIDFSQLNEADRVKFKMKKLMGIKKQNLVSGMNCNKAKDSPEEKFKDQTVND